MRFFINYIKFINTYLVALLISVTAVSCNTRLSEEINKALHPPLSGRLFEPIKNIPTNKSVIYLYRPIDNQESKFLLEYNGKHICLLESGGYFPLFVEEGKVKISVRPKLVEEVYFVCKAEKGKYYYVLCQTYGTKGRDLRMELVSESFGIKSIKKCRLLEQISQ